MTGSRSLADSRYTVQGREYQYPVSAAADKLAGQELMGRRFWVEYYPPNPAIDVLRPDAPVPDSLAPAPADSWARSPVYVSE